ncbi:MAG TPA: efflux RND transporter periplasmic adaptor subunit, partial [Micromonosporaceae bacterium]
MKLRVRVTKSRVIILVLAVVVVAGAGIGVWAATRPASAATTTFVPVSDRTLRQTISSSGTIEPAQQEDLNFAVSGQVTGVTATVGQQVTAGTALATVNSASLAASVAEAQATESSDQSRLDSDQTADASATQINADQAALTAAQNQVTNAQNALSEATLTAPISGTIAAVNLTVGQQVSGGSSSTGSSGTASSGSGGGGSTGGTGGTGGGGGGASSGSSSSSTGTSSSSAQIVLISNGSYVVNASVDDTEVGQVKNGDQAVITADGSTQAIYGTVSSVALLASGSSSVPSYPVTIGVTGSPSGLYAGASATVSIIVKQLTNVLTVQSAAIHYVNGKSVVYVKSGTGVTAQTVTLGMSEGGSTQVLTGLSEGQQVQVPAAPARTGTTGGTGTTGRTGGAGGAGRFGGGGGLT